MLALCFALSSFMSMGGTCMYPSEQRPLVYTSSFCPAEHTPMLLVSEVEKNNLESEIFFSGFTLGVFQIPFFQLFL